MERSYTISFTSMSIGLSVAMLIRVVQLHLFDADDYYVESPYLISLRTPPIRESFDSDFDRFVQRVNSCAVFCHVCFQYPSAMMQACGY